MPFLWRSNIKEQLNTSKKKPSPKHGRENSPRVQNSIQSNDFKIQSKSAMP